MKKQLMALVLVALLGAACGDDGAEDSAGSAVNEGATTTTEPEPAVGDRIESIELDGQPRLAVEVVATGLRVPSNITSPPDDDRLFVVERLHGQIRIIEDGVVRPEPFLDVSEQLEPSGKRIEKASREGGLLALTFHPDYATNGRFFVYYADMSGIPHLVEYSVSDDPNRADPESAVVLREFPASPQHYGGSMFFGPDGALWFGIGDGGQGQWARDVTHPRGALYRFDVSTPGTLAPAEGNPFLGDHEGVDGMWAYGLRNPWRVTIDDETGLLYIADVGRDVAEEINVVPMEDAGLNYGWNIIEANQCVEPGCDPSGTVKPAVEVLREEGVCAIIGGYVYRGEAIPELQGAYLYSDYCGGFLRSFRFEDGAVTDQLEWFDGIGNISNFGRGGDGEIYMTDHQAGTVLKLVPAE